MTTKLIDRRITLLVLFIGPAVTLVVSPTVSYDPINLIKVLALTTISFAGFGLLMSSPRMFKDRLSRKFWLTISFFIFSMFSTFLFSGAPKGQQFWGTFGRQTGILTYFSLLLLLVLVAVTADLLFYRKIVLSLIITGIPITIYALVQVANLDRVGWSSKDIFATLGNSNFLSAFQGLVSVVCVVLAFESKINSLKRFSLIVFAIIDMSIVLRSGSIQGFMIFVAGIGVGGYLILRKLIKSNWPLFAYSLISCLGTVFAVLGLVNKGPFSKFIYQESILFRADYMHAGWAMTLKRPFFGVGMDSYGDWYRTVRGLISTTRTGPERTANTAHNIFLDISSNGGFPFLIVYLTLLALAFTSAIKLIKSSRNLDFIFIAIFSSWISYQIQAAVSINQVGVGVWGWILTGALIGYSRMDLIPTSTSVNSKNKKTSTLPPGAALLSLIFMFIGFLVAFVPLNADLKYRAAINQGRLDLMMQSTKLPGSNSWVLSRTLEAAINNKFIEQAKVLNKQLRENYPLEIYGWKTLYLLATNPTEKELAVVTLHKLDPFNPNNPKS